MVWLKKVLIDELMKDTCVRACVFGFGFVS